ncbi:uncharacterized protein LOC141595511 [Silene latifolia]|uniref:uncharacterized protein LOC141595511 n=1 Tax=Silene latifolia TaxID=37657 RepID=UPI003D77A550
MFVSSKIVPELAKLESLDGHNYKRWSQKLLMYFEQLGIDYVLFNDPPKPITPTDVETTPPAVKDVKSNEEDIAKFVKDKKTARWHILNNMTNTLFDLFAGMKLDDIFVANVLLEKFPPSWSDYRNQLKHKKKDLSLKELIGHMRTEEANRVKDLPASQSVIAPAVAAVKANLVESGGPSYAEKYKGKHTKPVPKIQKAAKGPIVCYVCGKPGHKAYQCSEKKSAEANVVCDDDVIAAVVVEANLVGNVLEWVLNRSF